MNPKDQSGTLAALQEIAQAVEQAKQTPQAQTAPPDSLGPAAQAVVGMVNALAPEQKARFAALVNARKAELYKMAPESPALDAVFAEIPQVS